MRHTDWRANCSCPAPTVGVSSRMMISLLGAGCTLSCTQCGHWIAKRFSRDELPDNLKKKREEFWASDPEDW